LIKKNSKIFLAGHNGLVGSSIFGKLKFLGFQNIITIDKKKLNLINQRDVFAFFKKIKPEIVINAAARVGGIHANNKYRAEFIYENLSIQNNIIHGCFLNKIKNLIFLGSSCVYPKNCRQPIKEEYLLTGPLEKTNEPYAIAKISGIKMCESYNFQYKTNYKCLMPANTYGPNDNYDFESSHFFPAIINKVYLAKTNNKKFITLWGSGKAKRELIYVDDIADACIYFMDKNVKEAVINIGTGNAMSISEYGKFVIKELDANLKIRFDKSKPDGTPIKVLDISLAKKYGWYPKTDLKTGLKLTYKSFLEAFASNSSLK
jgi:GDP-L-fucose synthase